MRSRTDPDHPTPDARVFQDRTEWPWTESLGGARPDRRERLRVKWILFDSVRERCHELGLREGEEVRCRERSADRVVVELPDRAIRRLELPFAWFVQVEPVGEERPADTGGSPGERSTPPRD